MQTIGLIAAMPQERDALLRCRKGWKKISLGQAHYHRLQLVERDCWLVTCGVGIKRATAGTRLLLEQVHPQIIITFGIAGGVYADLEIGDVISASRTCLLENGVADHFQSLAHLSEAAWQAVAKALQIRGARLLDGTTVTTPGSQVAHLPDQVTNPVLEMETSGIAQVAAEAGIPLLSLRSISDGPGAPIPFDLAAVYDSEYNYRIGKMLAMILRQPKILLQSRQMVRNSTLAAENAALAVTAVLEQALIVGQQPV